MIEKMKDAVSPEEMRAEIYRMERYDPLVRSVSDAANYRGMSSEDRYTMLAYYALRNRERLMDIALSDAMIQPLKSFIFSPESLDHGK